ncbi:RNA polymerase [Rhizodiscina lignyota]|uniref:DNA-directed RNA polymerases I, II, and III subunit RPABC3 n=1 Tax=Rhizodiscina lignyota TaxID=1504668 RepID=A0A9P4MF40_9PEZI|nr:RNA polymerase [Rhizodiscina lignyota]
MSDSTLFESTFQINSVNPGRYDRVVRISATSLESDSTSSITLTLDINSELYQLTVGEKVDVCLASTLNLDGSKDSDQRGFRDVSRSGPAASLDTTQTLADSFDYVMFGKVYRFDEGEGENIKMYASFGGLLLFIEGPYKRLTPLRIDYLYLLMKK